MNKTKKSKRGGARPGPKLKYGEPTILVAFRCPVSFADLLKKEIKDYLDLINSPSYKVIMNEEKA